MPDTDASVDPVGVAPTLANRSIILFSVGALPSGGQSSDSITGQSRSPSFDAGPTSASFAFSEDPFTGSAMLAEDGGTLRCATVNAASFENVGAATVPP